MAALSLNFLKPEGTNSRVLFEGCGKFIMSLDEEKSPDEIRIPFRFFALYVYSSDDDCFSEPILYEEEMGASGKYAKRSTLTREMLRGVWEQIDLIPNEKIYEKKKNFTDEFLQKQTSLALLFESSGSFVLQTLDLKKITLPPRNFYLITYDQNHSISSRLPYREVIKDGLSYASLEYQD